ncbi:Sucraseferredoxin-like protein [Ganoderma leucocontextum]|nr:Sucraseferredoxin-like protein [Ganoderma leucocontextum]
MDQTRNQLQEADIPVSDAPCRGCADPCDEGSYPLTLVLSLGHDEYPNFDVDHETQMLGSIKPYGRQVVISTGKTDWVHDVTGAKGTLAACLSSVTSSRSPKDKEMVEKRKEEDKPRTAEDKPPNGVSVAGVFNADPYKLKKISILNGSHRTVSDDHTKETVLIFPDWKVLTEVDPTQAGAEALYKHSVSPSIPLSSAPPSENAGSLKSWILPYACVILLCSHKRRDNRCAIAAPKLEHSLTLALEREGWEVHHQVEDPSASGPALEDDPTLAGMASDEDRHAEIARRLQAIDAAHAPHKRALILFCSHIGGHKYAGNVIINTPRGVSVWYGRVTSHEVDAIVKETIVGGKILHPLLRGGLNLCHPGRNSLNDW